MPNDVATTAPVLGPGNTPSSLNFTNVKSVKFDFEKNVVEVLHGVPPYFTYLEDAPIHGGTTYTVNADNTVDVAISWS